MQLAKGSPEVIGLLLLGVVLFGVLVWLLVNLIERLTLALWDQVQRFFRLWHRTNASPKRLATFIQRIARTILVTNKVLKRIREENTPDGNPIPEGAVDQQCIGLTAIQDYLRASKRVRGRHRQHLLREAAVAVHCLLDAVETALSAAMTAYRGDKNMNVRAELRHCLDSVRAARTWLPFTHAQCTAFLAPTQPRVLPVSASAPVVREPVAPDSIHVSLVQLVVVEEVTAGGMVVVTHSYPEPFLGSEFEASGYGPFSFLDGAALIVFTATEFPPAPTDDRNERRRPALTTPRRLPAGASLADPRANRV